MTESEITASAFGLLAMTVILAFLPQAAIRIVQLAFLPQAAIRIVQVLAGTQAPE
jgi:hypothetical protein